MSINPRIKVIKLAERKRRAKVLVRQEQAATRRSGQDKTVNATDTVTGWVDELRRQKQQDAGAASNFNNLFEDAP